MTATADTIVIGGGMVGSAIAWGLCRRGVKVLVLDGADDAERAARANSGWSGGNPRAMGWPNMLIGRAKRSRFGLPFRTSC